MHKSMACSRAQHYSTMCNLHLHDHWYYAISQTEHNHTELIPRRFCQLSRSLARSLASHHPISSLVCIHLISVSHLGIHALRACTLQILHVPSKGCQKESDKILLLKEILLQKKKTLQILSSKIGICVCVCIHW